MFRWRAKPAQLAAPAVALAAASWLVAQQTPVIRVNVNLVRIIATVKTRTGAIVGSLRKDDFERLR